MGKKKSLPFDKTGGVLAIQRRLIESGVYLKLPPQAKALMQLMQVHWRNERPIGFGTREAAEKIPCSRKTAMQAFKSLQDFGFIVMVGESVFFDGRTQSKSRTWRLTWLPYNSREPTNEWEKK